MCSVEADSRYQKANVSFNTSSCKIFTTLQVVTTCKVVLLRGSMLVSLSELTATILAKASLKTWYCRGRAFRFSTIWVFIHLCVWTVIFCLIRLFRWFYENTFLLEQTLVFRWWKYIDDEPAELTLLKTFLWPTMGLFLAHISSFVSWSFTIRLGEYILF